MRGTVGDDTAPRPITVRVASKHQSADGDRLIHGAVPAEVADRPAVELPAYRLELVDDFHRAHLWSAHEGTRGKGRGKQVEGILSRPQAAVDAADDVHDVAVALDHAVGIHHHRARRSDPAQVVARQIDQHHVLGIFLGIRLELRFQRGIEHGVGTARAGACDRPQLRVPIVTLHQRFGRRAHHRDVAQLAKIHIGRGIEQPQRAVHLERRKLLTSLEPRRQHQLIDVAGGNVLLRAPHPDRVLCFRQRGPGRRKASRNEYCRHGAAQGLHHVAAQTLPFGLAAVVQQRHRAGQMIEHQQGLWGHIVGMRSFGRIEIAARHAFEVADGIIGGVADQSAEQGYPRYLGQRPRCLGESAAQSLQELAPGPGPRGMNTADVEPRGVQSHFQTIAESDEGITRQPLSSLDAFQQEPRAKGRQLQIGRHRRIEICRDVKRRLHVPARISRTIKNPPPALGGDGFWIPTKD